MGRDYSTDRSSAWGANHDTNKGTNSGLGLPQPRTRASCPAVPDDAAVVQNLLKLIRALAAYKEFLTLWKDADPDIPILKKAKAEYEKLL
jgi:hypothetical protein